MYDFYVVLGCFGLRTDDFVSCSGVENVIIKVNTSLNGYNEMMDYFDQCRLFDKPLFDANAIRHFVFNMQERYDQVVKKLWTEKKFQNIQKFCIDHRLCGLFINLRLPEDFQISTEPDSSSEEPIFIKSTDIRSAVVVPREQPLKVSDNKLRLVRGRK